MPEQNLKNSGQPPFSDRQETTNFALLIATIIIFFLIVVLYIFGGSNSNEPSPDTSITTGESGQTTENLTDPEQIEKEVEKIRP